MNKRREGLRKFAARLIGLISVCLGCTWQEQLGLQQWAQHTKASLLFVWEGHAIIRTHTSGAPPV
eukprot:scaffold577813_cov24-Prasinocladus_malaysianus.AAC.1